MESFRLVCRDERGEWHMQDLEAADATAAFEAASALGLSPHVVVPTRLGRGPENAIVQRWKQGAVELGECLHCGYDLRGLVRAADRLAICPECGVGAVMKPVVAAQMSGQIELVPGFKPGLMLDRWGMAISVLGFVYFPVAFVGILMGVFAHEFSRGARGRSAIGTGVAALVVNLLIFVAKATGLWP